MIRKLLGLAVVTTLATATLATASVAAPGDITLASTNDAGVKGNGVSAVPDLSADGTVVAFGSDSTNLDPNDTFGNADIYVKDLTTGAITLASTDDAGIGDIGDSQFPSISADGTVVAFQSFNTLDPGDPDFDRDVYLKDLTTGDTILASTDDSGVNGDGESTLPTLSGDGSRVAFESSATNLDPGDTDPASDVYVKDLTTGNVTLVSTSDAGTKGNGASFNAELSADGTHVAFESTATNLDPGDTDAFGDIYVKDLTTGNITLVSTSDSGTKGNDASTLGTIAADGSSVAFRSVATNLDPGDTDAFGDVYVKDLATGDLTLVSTDDGGAKGNGDSISPTISTDGATVAFRSLATNLDPGDTDAISDVFVKDLSTGDLSLASTSDGGLTKGNGESLWPALTADGGAVAFYSRATNLDPNDADPIADVYVKELGAAPPNTPPAAADDAYSTPQGVNLSVPAPGVLGNDTDADGDPLTAALVAGPANGTLTLNADGSFAYQAAGGFSGTDSFTYRANDGAADSNVATVTITVTPSGCTGLCLSIADASLTEGTSNKGTTPIRFTVSLAGTLPKGGVVTVLAATRDGSATAGSDYVANAAQLSFRRGQMTATFTVRVVPDNTLEPAETFFVDLSAPVGAGISDGEGVGTIANDD